MEEYGFFGAFYLEGDNSKEGYLQTKKQNLDERTKEEVDGVINLSSGGRSSRVLPSHRTGSGHSGLRSACRLPSEACRSHRFLPDVRAALREVCRSLRGALRAPLGAAASRSAGGGRAVPRVRPAPGRFCPPSLPFVQERTPGRVLMPHAELLRQLSGQTRRAVC